MEHIRTATLIDFLVQLFLWSAYIPGSYFAYRWARAPLKRDRVRKSLSQLGVILTRDLEESLIDEYHLKHYLWPMLIAWAVTVIFLATTHPFLILGGWWVGGLEETINMFGVDHLFPRAILTGRALFWGWLGAYAYSFHLTFRRFLAFDLTLSVYIFSANRFFLAYVVGAAVSVGISTFSTAAGVPYDMNMATVAIVNFFIGFFPEQGVNWIAATARKMLKQNEGIAKEQYLSEIDGLSIWHQGRLKQEGIENVQNLANTDLPKLIISTSFHLTEIIDWVDQAILIAHTNKTQFAALEKSGAIRASEVLANTKNNPLLESFANNCHLDKDTLKIVRQNLLSALNIKLVWRLRQQMSLNTAKVEEFPLLDVSI